MCIGQMKRLSSFFQKIVGKSRGGVLIEFAFSLPLLILVLFFMRDCGTIYRFDTKMKKMSELIAQMIYNSKGSMMSELTLRELENISTLVGVTLTGKKGSEKNPLDEYPFYFSMYVMCIEGTTENKFLTKWCVHIQNNLKTGHVIGISENPPLYSRFNSSTLNIQEGEIKLVIETVAWYKENKSSRGFNSKFHLMRIKHTNASNNAILFGNTFSVITPQAWLIDKENPPQ